MSTTTETLHFYTEGVGFTNLLRDFIEEGRNYTVYQILRDGGFTDNLANQFIRGELKFTGTTQFGGDLEVEKEGQFDANTMLEQSLRSILTKYAEEHDDEDDLTDMERLKKYIKDADIHILKNAFGEETLLNVYRTDVINEYTIGLIEKDGWGYIRARDVHRASKDDVMDGLILPNGDVITCGYQEHSSLYPFLQDLGIVKVSCWTDCEETIHISSGQIGGEISHGIGSRWRTSTATDECMQTLFKLRRHLVEYGRDYEITYKLLKHVGISEGFGNKWNNLVFLQKYYQDIQVPRISKEPIEGVKNCLRTSPLYSLPGLLESVFDITETSVAEIEATFEKYSDVRKDNELNIFYQEYIEGANGVFHCDRDGFRWDISTNRGDIVQGKKGNVHVSETVLRKLKALGESLHLDFDKDIQVEFVVNGDEFWVLQLRILENNPERTVIIHRPEEAIVDGKTFSKGSVEIDVNDILVLDSDGASELLLGKKALIIKEDVEFSHILALSAALKIPSIYGTGEIKLPKEGKIKFEAYNKEAWITLI